MAGLAFSEQASAERVNAGEYLDTIAVRFEGRTFTLAGKLLDISLAQATGGSAIPQVVVAKVPDFWGQDDT